LIVLTPSELLRSRAQKVTAPPTRLSRKAVINLKFFAGPIIDHRILQAERAEAVKRVLIEEFFENQASNA
jgi:hypothetical protein